LDFSYRDKKVVGVFVRFRAPLQWAVLWLAGEHSLSIPSNILVILIGASLYLIGVIFYLWKKYRYNHALSFFVLAAAVCHYVAILLAVASK
jgi:channel protein (hemolysin III family)